MNNRWTGTLIGKMHNNGVTCSDLSRQLGVSKNYISMILHGKRNPAGAKEKLNDALSKIISERAK